MDSLCSIPALASSLLRHAETTDPLDAAGDTITAGNGPDVVLGGSGGDAIEAGTDPAPDTVIGDNGIALFAPDGILVDIRTTVPTIGGDDDILVGDGDDVVLGGLGSDFVDLTRPNLNPVVVDNGDDVMIGDNGFALFDAVLGQRITRRVETTDPTLGDSDSINAGNGSDIVLAGSGSDFVDAGTDAARDIVIGDNGTAIFNASETLTRIETTAPSLGGKDVILTTDGPDVVLGGVDNDTVNAGTDAANESGNDVVLGDNGVILFDDSGVMLESRTTSPEIGGKDTITTGGSDDVVLGGNDEDAINTGEHGGADIVIGDNGLVTFDSVAGSSLLRQIETTDAPHGHDDTIFTGNGPDIVMAGTGNDNVDAGTDAARDIVIGDNGSATFNAAEILTRIGTTAPAIGGKDVISTTDGPDIVLGGIDDDTIDAGTDAASETGNDVVLGDNGFIDFDDAGVMTETRTTSPDIGGKDTITTGGDDDVVLGGLDEDSINTGAHGGADIVVGDNGLILFDSAGGTSILRQIETSDAAHGHGDTIDTGNGPDVVLGGSGADDVQAGADAARDIVIGDNGAALFDTASVLFDIRTTDPSTGGNDTIEVGNGDDVVLGGVASDTINAGTDTGADVVIGDNGFALFDTDSGSSLLRNIETSNPLDAAGDTIAVGNGPDVVLGGSGSDDIEAGLDGARDIVVGDNGRALFDATGPLVNIQTTVPDIGGDDDILVGDGDDVVLGGFGSDFVNAARPGAERRGVDTGRDVMVGDNGEANFDAVGGASVLRRVETTDPALGDADWIFAGDGPDVVLGGSASDFVDAGDDGARDIVVGDNGVATFNAAEILTHITTTAPEIGGADTIWTTNGPDVVLGGVDNDTIDAGTDDAGDTGGDVVLGDNGYVQLSDLGQLNHVETTEPDIGGDDFVTTGGGEDLVIGGDANDEIRSGADNDIVIGDNGVARFTSDGLLTDVQTTSPGIGGMDLVYSHTGDDVVFGGADDDEIHGGDNRDLLFGDNALLDNMASDTDPLTRDLATTIDPLFGGQDDIFGDAGFDHIFGGTTSDTISGGADHDVILGDHGLWDRTLPLNHNYRSIFITDADGAGPDTIHGDDGDDFILGQQASDLIYGDAGEDDIWGGHNVLHGDDEGDEIHGGLDADVVLGENGLILRTLLPEQDDEWERYPAPFPDVIREVTRFDDADRITGDDLIFGDEHDDILHGQRGDDTIHGGSGDDEIYGELGDDTITGDDGHDVILGDVGIITRDFTSENLPRLNENGAWHRDVFLQDVAGIAGIVNSDNTKNLGPQNLAEQLLTTDVLIGTGSFNPNGSQRNNPATGSWETDLLLVDLVPSNRDNVHGGPGEDLIFGQRGDDFLRGGGDDDLIIGDTMKNLIPFDTELPLVNTGYLLIETAENIPFSLNQFGNTINTPVSIQPEELQLNDPHYLAPTLADFLNGHAAQAELFDQSLVRNDGASIRPMISVVPDIIHHTDLFGADEIIGDAGNDWLVGDRMTAYTPWLTGLQPITDAEHAATDSFKRTMHTAGELAIDFERLRQQNGEGVSTHDIHIANDLIRGGIGDDRIFGDDSVLISSFKYTLPAEASEFTQQAVDYYDYLRQMEQLATDVELTMFGAHHRVLGSLISEALATNPTRQPLPASQQVDPNYHDLFVGNDQIYGDNGEDQIAGDHGVVIATIVDGQQFELVRQDSSLPAAVWSQTDAALASRQASFDSGFAQHILNAHDVGRQHSNADMAMIPWNYEYELKVGSDVVRGGGGDDLVMGDFGAFANPISLTIPSNNVERSKLDQEVRNLTDNIARYLEQYRHDPVFDRIVDQFLHVHYVRGAAAQEVAITAGRDVLYGNDGNDFVIGDSESVSVTILEDAPTTRYSEPDPEFKVKFYERENYELRNNYARNSAASRIGEDSLIGGTGNDFLFGHVRDDILYGGGGNDIVYGGSGFNQANDQSGTNDLRPGSNNRPEGAELDKLEDYQFGSMTSFEFRHVFDVVGTEVSNTGGTQGPDNAIIQTVAGPAGIEIIGLTEAEWRTVDPDSDPILAWNPNVNPEQTLAGDFNGDGKDDIARFQNGKWWISASNGSGFSTTLWSTLGTKTGLKDVNVLDANGDGRDDIVFRVGARVRVLVSSGSSFWNQEWTRWTAQTAWQDVLVGDFNADGKDDLLRRNGGEWFVSTSTGSKFDDGKWATTHHFVLFAGVGDTNDDGRDDVIVRIGRNVRVLRSTGSSFQNSGAAVLASTALWDNAAIADINGDGKADVVAHRDGTFWFGVTNGQAMNFSVAGTIALDWEDFVIVDVDKDEKDELFITSADRIWIVESNEGTLEQTLAGRSHEGLSWSMLVGDFIG